MTTLISFLGKGRLDATTGYRKARYRFADDFVREVPYFGLALAEFIKPKKIILVGTAGSMWDVFFEQQGELDETLIDAVAAERVDEDLLAQHELRLTEKLGTAIKCMLIPYAKDEAEQIAILGHMAGQVHEHETIALDVTHGFRHLPMLALVAARYLKHVARVKIKDIYYGALEMKSASGETPVLRLGGLLQMLDWVEALTTYDKDGDYGVFAPLLEADGMPGANLFAQAAFFERTSNPVKAREKLVGADQALDRHAGPMTALFKRELKNRIAWYRRKTRHDQERALADAYLKRRDYLRAAIYLYEACVTQAVNADQGGDSGDFNAREVAWKKLRQEKPEAKKLEYLRNALAHGLRSDNNDVRRMLASEANLKKALESFSHGFD